VTVLILGVVETALLSLLDSIAAIVTEDITSGSEKLAGLLSKIGEATGVYMTKVCIQVGILEIITWLKIY
jgi:hypothetical protein